MNQAARNSASGSSPADSATRRANAAASVYSSRTTAFADSEISKFRLARKPLHQAEKNVSLRVQLAFLAERQRAIPLWLQSDQASLSYGADAGWIEPESLLDHTLAIRVAALSPQLNRLFQEQPVVVCVGVLPDPAQRPKRVPDQASPAYVTHGTND